MQPLQPIEIFKALGSDAAHRGVDDLHPAHLAALQQALNTAEPFDTGWYSDKHEGETARISCLDDPEKVTVKYSVVTDEDENMEYRSSETIEIGSPEEAITAIMATLANMAEQAGRP